MSGSTEGPVKKRREITIDVREVEERKRRENGKGKEEKTHLPRKIDDYHTSSLE